MKKFILLSIFILIYCNGFTQDVLTTEGIVKKTFTDVKTICDKDNGALWGKNIWGPILYIDRETRAIIANQQDSAGILKKVENLYFGTFPSDNIVANSTTNIWGTFWATVSMLPEDDFTRNSLFIHEAFHRLQPELGVTNKGYENNHLDNITARILMKLEWSALKTSIIKSDSIDCHSILDALIFRNYRRSLFPGSDSMENRFEIHEGLAEYTSNKLCSSSVKELEGHLLAKHEDYWNKESLVRSFGYYSGFFYAFLLDCAKINWRGSVTSSTDLGMLLRDSLNLIMPHNLQKAYDSIKTNYDYSAIKDSEELIRKTKEALISKYTDSFLKNPVLKIGLIYPHFGFNVNSLQPLDSCGVVYETIVIIDEWGTLNVSSEGCLISNDWSYALVPATYIKVKENKIQSKSWELILNDHWEMIQKESNYYLKLK
ncbi:MAG: hypothetical protein ACM3PX_02170 [Omnitrophica WOR_2 bacterium]